VDIFIDLPHRTVGARAGDAWMDGMGVCVWMFGHVESSNARDRDRRPTTATATATDDDDWVRLHRTACDENEDFGLWTLDFGLWTLDDGW